MKSTRKIDQELYILFKEMYPENEVGDLIADAKRAYRSMQMDPAFDIEIDQFDEF